MSGKKPPIDLGALAQDAERELQRRNVERRKGTIMRMAGNIASGLVANPSMRESPRSVASFAVRVAEEIVTIVDLMPEHHAMRGRRE